MQENVTSNPAEEVKAIRQQFETGLKAKQRDIEYLNEKAKGLAQQLEGMKAQAALQVLKLAANWIEGMGVVGPIAEQKPTNAEQLNAEMGEAAALTEAQINGVLKQFGSNEEKAPDDLVQEYAAVQKQHAELHARMTPQQLAQTLLHDCGEKGYVCSVVVTVYEQGERYAISTVYGGKVRDAFKSGNREQTIDLFSRMVNCFPRELYPSRPRTQSAHPTETPQDHPLPASHQKNQGPQNNT